MNLLFVSYYGQRDALKSASDSLAKKGFKITDFPLFQWSRDQHDKRDDYLELLDQCIVENNIEVILFWCLALTTADLVTLRKRHAKRVFSFFNWDDPFAWQVKDLDIHNKAVCFDVVFTCSEEARKNYLSNGAKQAVWLLPGFDPKLHQPKPDPKKVCDVALCATQLYRSNEDSVCRYSIAKALEAEPSINFKLYGPQSFAAEFPRSYAGFLKYADTCAVYHNSMINLCTHVVLSEKYINERVILVLASGGVALIDAVPGLDEIFKPNEYVALQADRIVDQIKELLADPAQLAQIRTAALKRAISQYTWDHWAETVYENIVKAAFDPVIYRGQVERHLGKLEVLDRDLFDHWRFVGRNLSCWATRLEVPDTFLWREYCALNKVSFSSAQETWLHWIRDGEKTGAILPKKASVVKHDFQIDHLPTRRKGQLLSLVSEAGGDDQSISTTVNQLLDCSRHYPDFDATDA